MSQSLRALFVCLLLLCPSAATATNGPATVSSGIKGPVSLSIDGDGQTMYRMPSSIGWSLGHRVDLDLFIFYSEQDMQNSLNDFSSSGSTFGASLGFVIAPGRPDFGDAPADDDEDPVVATDSDFEDPWDTYSYANKFTVAFGVFPAMAGGGGDKSEIQLASFTDKISVRKAIQFIDITGAIAFTPTEWLSVGLGLHLITTELKIATVVGGNSTPLNGSPQVTDGVNFPGNPSYSDLLSLFSSDGTSDPTTVFKTRLNSFQFASTISLSLRPLDNLGFGFSYRPRSWDPLRFTGSATIDVSQTFAALGPGTLPLLLLTLPNGGTEFAANDFKADYDVELVGTKVPRQIRFNTVFWPTDSLLIAAEVAWIEWHRAFRKTNVYLSNGDNADLNFIVGSDKIHTKLDALWSNQWVFSLYSAYAVKDVTFRAGFVYGKTPFNEDTQGVAPNAGLSDSTVMLGMGWRVFGSPLELSWMVEHSFRTSQTSGSNLNTLTAQNTDYSAKQWFFHLGVSYSF
jgi:long-subunit fatty acid transport protein